MNVLEKKPPRQYNDELKRLIKLLTYRNHRLELKGSASLASQQYFSDYDFFCVLKADKDDFIAFLQDVLKKLDEAEDYWFMELKLQTSGKKIRFYPEKEFKVTDKVWDVLDFIKIDLVARIDGFFTEVSCIYSFTKEDPSKEDYIRSLEEDISELKREKKYYKILKRRFNIAKAQGDKKEVLRLSRIFNSDLGKEYQLISRLEAMSNLLALYQDSVVKKIQIGLKDLQLDAVDSLEQYIKDKSRELNTEAKRFL